MRRDTKGEKTGRIKRIKRRGRKIKDFKNKNSHANI
jgi:hypothetical protein